MYKTMHSPSQKCGEEVHLERTAVAGHVEDTDLRTDDPLHSDCLEQQDSLPFPLWTLSGNWNQTLARDAATKATVSQNVSLFSISYAVELELQAAL